MRQYLQILELFTLFLKTCNAGIILDESQKIKNPQAKLTIDFHKIACHFTRRIIMTGTPIANRPYDIWSQIKFLDNGEALGTSFHEFKNNVDLPKKSSHSLEYSGYLSDIFGKIKKFSVRETKKTAELALPDKTILTHFCEMEARQASIYKAYKNELMHEFLSENGVVVDDAEYILKRLLRLVQCASNPSLVDKTYKKLSKLPGKFLHLLDLFKEIDLELNKVIIWTGFIDNVEWLSNQLQIFSPQKVHSGISIAERYTALEKFKMEKTSRLLIATPGAAKEGLTLTVANHAIFFDRSFSLDDYLQAQDRIHRISQTQECFVHNLIAKDTIDEWVDALLNAKYQAAQLAQGDIQQSEFAQTFNFDLSDALEKILAPIAS